MSAVATDRSVGQRSLVRGLSHVAILTADSDRFVAFYQDVFGVSYERLHDDDGFTFTLVALGPGAVLTVFEIAGNTEHGRQQPMFGRGRLDHMALEAGSIEAFDEIRERLIARGATDGFVTDFGPILSVCFRDPDGLESEVCVQNPDARPGVHNSPGTPALRYHPDDR